MEFYIAWMLFILAFGAFIFLAVRAKKTGDKRYALGCAVVGLLALAAAFYLGATYISLSASSLS